MFKLRTLLLVLLLVCFAIMMVCPVNVFADDDSDSDSDRKGPRRAKKRVKALKEQVVNLEGRIEVLEAENAAQETQILEADIRELEAEYAAQEQHIKVFKGTIIMWSGEIDADGHPLIDGETDTNWVICDGRPGTPDLSDRFIIGASAARTPHSQGGSGEIELSTENIPTHDHNIVASTEMDGVHRHTYNDRTVLLNQGWVGGAGKGWRSEAKWTFQGNWTDEKGGQQEHEHKIDARTTYVGDGMPYPHLPPFYSLTFLIYVGD
jgi:TolA-binding protein